MLLIRNATGFYALAIDRFSGAQHQLTVKRTIFRVGDARSADRGNSPQRPIQGLRPRQPKGFP